MGSRLVLVKWYGDVIATKTLPPGELPDVSWGYSANGVSFEIHDVAYTRASLSLDAAFDGWPLLAFAASLLVHMGLASLFASVAGSVSPAALTKEREETLHAYMMRLPRDERASGPEGRDQRGEELRWDGPSTTTPPAGGAAHPSTATPATAAALCEVPRAPPTSSAMCSRSVRVTSLTRSSPSCFTDNVVEVGQAGTLTFPCEGDGPAVLRVGLSSFEGAEIGERVVVCTGTEFPWSDGCKWTSAQRVSGDVNSGELVFTYGEAPRAGQRRSCASACSATGTVRVEGS